MDRRPGRLGRATVVAGHERKGLRGGTPGGGPPERPSEMGGSLTPTARRKITTLGPAKSVSRNVLRSVPG